MLKHQILLLNDHIFQDLVQDETRAKLAALGKARQEHDEKEALQDRLEEEEESRKQLEKQNADLQAKVFKNKICEKWSS